MNNVQNFITHLTLRSAFYLCWHLEENGIADSGHFSYCPNKWLSTAQIMELIDALCKI